MFYHIRDEWAKSKIVPVDGWGKIVIHEAELGLVQDQKYESPSENRNH